MKDGEVSLDIEAMTLPKDAVIITTEEAEKELENIVRAAGVPARLIVIDSFHDPAV